MSKILVYLINPSRSSAHTPFGKESFLQACRAEITSEISRADILVAAGLREVEEIHVAARKPIFTYTYEPKWDHNDRAMIKGYLGGGDVYIFNVYNWNVYLDNFRYAPTGARVALKTKASTDRNVFEARKTAVFAAYRKYPVIIRGSDVALDEFRSEISMGLHRHGRCDIFGVRWPGDIALGESRTVKNWSSVKCDALREYAFNFCSENTNFDFYVTEKFWHAVGSGVLPIYYPTESFYHVAPADSFIDMRQMKEPTAESLLHFIDSIQLDEYVERYNKCAQLYNICIDQNFKKKSIERSDSHLLAYVLGIAGDTK